MHLTQRRRKNLIGWAFVAPAFVHLMMFAIFAIITAGVLSCFKWQIYKPHADFIGLKNYAWTFQQAGFWNAMWNSLKFTLMSVPAGMAVALAIATLVNQRLRGMAIFRTIFYIPAITSGIAISMLWIYIYLPETGLINSTLHYLLGPHGKFDFLLSWVHLKPYSDVDFLNSESWAMPAVAFMSIWTSLGPRMILYLAGLLNIPQTLYEAAHLDGAKGWKLFRNVTWPMLAPTTLFVLITSTIGALQVFTPIYLMTKGGPNESTDVIGYHIYTEAWVNFNTGLAAAKSFVLLAVIAAISLGQFALMRRSTEAYAA